ncbi:hypothetical protein [Hyphomicrobium sp.]|jgi:hypothetical protein|uniref:hypothetical protein n=1 Tax=Hyphomicrobium sp. TaxID=82 RepID=UPI002C877194|nr:hypothetical protein [Hyphomicrobium sp.]HVZ04473.1 hypothetical protein [Hyphomicrobium sp.]
MKRNLAAAATAALILAIAAPVVAQADSISGVESARAKERQGRYLNRHDREQLRRYGGNDDGYRYGYRDYGYYDDYYGGPGVSVYVGPGGVGVYGY